MQILKKLFTYYIGMIALLFVGRLLLFIWQFDRFSDSGVNYWLSFIYGLKMDTMVVSMLLVIPLVVLSFTPTVLSKIANLFLRLYFVSVFAFLIYMENATFPFFSQYDVRPNFKFVEYLEYRVEVFHMLIADFKLPLFIAFAMMGLFVWWFMRRSKESFISVLA
jgi:hypothetical protein